MKMPILTCSSCGKRSAHEIKIHPELDLLSDTELISACCQHRKVMGGVATHLMGKGFPFRLARRVEMVYWEIHEPFESMTPTEKGFVLASRGVKINYVDAFTGRRSKSIDNAIQREHQRHKSILNGIYWNKKSRASV